MKNKIKKIAILHDYFDKTGGGERLVINLARALKADIYTGFIERDKTFDTKGIKITSLGVRAKGNPLVRGRKIEKVFSKLKLEGYDFYIFSGVWCISAAKNHHPNLIYLHTIPRFAYDLREYYSKQLNPFSRMLFNKFIDKWRPVFEDNMKDFDLICTNSENVRNRLKKYLGKRLYDNSVAVNTNFDTRKFYYRKTGDFYLSTSRLDKLKRLDIVINAFKKNGKKLVIASSGPEEKNLRKLAADFNNIEFIGRVSEARLRELYADCKATIIAAVDEDLGLVPLESHAAGKPCIAVMEGGFLETVKEGKNGVFFDPYPESLNTAITRSEKIKWDKNYIISTSRNYDVKDNINDTNNFIKKYISTKTKINKMKMKPMQFLRNKMILLFKIPYMASEERKFIEASMGSEKVMAEFGAGNSTVHFAKKVKKYYAVEHNKEWHDRIKSRVGDNVTMFLAKNKNEYVNMAKKLPEKMDIVFLDGEWRIECAKALLNKIDKNTQVFVHDYGFTYDRDYSEILKWYKLKKQVGYMGLFTKK